MKTLLFNLNMFVFIDEHVFIYHHLSANKIDSLIYDFYERNITGLFEIRLFERTKKERLPICNSRFSLFCLIVLLFVFRNRNKI
jgi:hypothetical protein